MCPASSLPVGKNCRWEPCAKGGRTTRLDPSSTCGLLPERLGTSVLPKPSDFRSLCFFPKTWPPVEEGREQLVGIVWRAEPAPCILLGGPGEPSASGRQEGPPQGVVGIPGLPRARGLPRAPHGPVVPSGHLPPPVPPLCPASGSCLALHVHSLDTMQVITHTLAPRCFSSLGDTSSEV